MFYVTKSGLGAKSSTKKSLFFTCLYCLEDEDRLNLYLYKSALPRSEFLEAILDFRSASELQRLYFKPGQYIQEHSTLVLSEIKEFSFGFAKDKLEVFSGNLFAHDIDFSLELDWDEIEDSLEEFWLEKEIPGQAFMYYELEKEKSLYTILCK